MPLSDRGRTIGVLVVRSRVARSFGDDEVRFLESLANLLTSSLQRAQSEEALNHAQRLESVGQLTGGIAHDFNNLLTVIQGNLQVLAELPARRRRRCSGASSSTPPFAPRAAAPSSPASCSRSPAARCCSRSTSTPRAMLHSLADMLRRTLDQRIRIEVEIPPVGVAVRADPGQLESALLNIAINARDAMPGGGTLRFRVEFCAILPETVAAEVGAETPADRFVAIAIEDSGTGMTGEARERAFEPFFTTKEPGRGTGLGLSTVYGFARQSQGAVTLESALGRGTTVTLYLPRPAAEPQSAPLRSPSRTGPCRPGSRCCWSRTMPRCAAVMRRFLETLGCEVNEAASGEQAMLLLDAGRRFDLLLSDIALGSGMRGTELAARAQALSPELAIVLMSGYSAELLDADRDSPPAWELLRKPCTREELARRDLARDRRAPEAAPRATAASPGSARGSAGRSPRGRRRRRCGCRAGPSRRRR